MAWCVMMEIEEYLIVFSKAILQIFKTRIHFDAALKTKDFKIRNIWEYVTIFDSNLEKNPKTTMIDLRIKKH